MAGLASGKLRHSVRLMRPEAPGTDKRDGNGQPLMTPVMVATLWAAIKSLSSREYQIAQAMQVQASSVITIRYRGDIGSRWWFEYDDPGTKTTRVFQIEGTTDPDETRVELDCYCDERGTAN